MSSMKSFTRDGETSAISTLQEDGISKMEIFQPTELTCSNNDKCRFRSSIMPTKNTRLLLFDGLSLVRFHII